MKMFKMVSVLALSGIASACSSPDTAQTTSLITHGAAASIPTSGCSVTQSGGTAVITCADGTTASINNGSAGAAGSSGAVGNPGATGPAGAAGGVGAQGAAGVTGPTGAQGLAGKFHAVSNTGVTIGDEFIQQYNDGSSMGATLVHYDLGDVYTYYDGGSLGGVEYMYFAGTGCTGQAYVAVTPGATNGIPIAMGNLYFRQYTSNNMSTVQLYKTVVTSFVEPFAYQSKSIYGPTLDCINTGTLTDTFLMQAAAESGFNGNAAVLWSASLPISLSIQ